MTDDKPITDAEIDEWLAADEVQYGWRQQDIRIRPLCREVQRLRERLSNEQMEWIKAAHVDVAAEKARADKHEAAAGAMRAVLHRISCADLNVSAPVDNWLSAVCKHALASDIGAKALAVIEAALERVAEAAKRIRAMSTELRRNELTSALSDLAKVRAEMAAGE